MAQQAMMMIVKKEVPDWRAVQLARARWTI